MECPDTPSCAGLKSRDLFTRSLVFIPAGMFLISSAGCIQTSKTIPQSAVPPNAKIVKAEDQPKITPPTDTCIAFADLRLHAATDGSTQGESREEALSQARKLYDQALKSDPKCLDAYKGLAKLELARGNYDGALDYYRKALTISPKAAPIWYDLGACQARHGNWSAAVESLQQASTLDSSNRAYVKNLGFCLAKNGRYDDSIACFKRIMDEGQARYNLARLLHYEKQDDLCRLQIRMALQANPSLAAAQEFLAQLDNPIPAGSAAVSTASAPNLGPRNTGPNVGIDIDDVAAEISETPGSAN
jgi:tetratricopeptide (TPR) repeat protein